MLHPVKPSHLHTAGADPPCSAASVPGSVNQEPASHAARAVVTVNLQPLQGIRTILKLASVKYSNDNSCNWYDI